MEFHTEAVSVDRDKADEVFTRLDQRTIRRSIPHTSFEMNLATLMLASSVKEAIMASEPFMGLLNSETVRQSPTDEVDDWDTRKEILRSALYMTASLLDVDDDNEIKALYVETSLGGATPVFTDPPTHVLSLGPDGVGLVDLRARERLIHEASAPGYL